MSQKDRIDEYCKDGPKDRVNGLLFSEWLLKVDERVEAKRGIGVCDLPDRLWADEFESGAEPRAAADDFLEEIAEEDGDE